MKTTLMLKAALMIGFVCAATSSLAQRGAHPGGGSHPSGGGHPGGFGGAHVGAAPHATYSAARGGGGYVQRFNHGSIRHSDTHVMRAPEFHPEVHVERGGPSRGYYVHRDGGVDFGGHRYWNDFHRGHLIDALPLGFLSFNIGGLPYYYYGGVYYQEAPGGYEEVYPPVGAAVPVPPDGAFPVMGPNGVTYYYAAGAFYLQQPDGSFISVQTPLGVIVPELPPGAVQVNINGIVAYQFDGVYYQPVFANGITQYQTFVP
jgi:hypothetical protein